MKPITLKLSGLQSYREPQEVDFTHLCETGLFGIFGPTGSGKSTLLDAITLALYGKVERASGGTQGIMNHSEDSLLVAFTFELMSPAGAERFRVERRFKRTGEVSVSNTISRFIEITPEGEQVHADKLAEVTRCVEEKIGLKMDDFTRAVVLPQGKFAEFLSLKGSERRQMLQRLFHLEKYGDLLGMKLSRKVKETDSRLKELAAEQQGLGLASAEALQEADERLKAASAEAELRRRELQEAERLHGELAKLRELGLELQGREEALRLLRQSSAEIAAVEARLVRAAAAEQLRSALSAWHDAKRLAAERSGLAQQAEAAAAEAEAAARQAAVAAEAAQQALALEEPGLLVRLDQLEQAKALQAERDALRAEQAALQGKLDEAVKSLAAHREQLAKEELLLAKAKQRREQLALQLKEVEVTASERRSLQIAVSLRDRQKQLEERRLKGEKSLSELKGWLFKAETDLAENSRQAAALQEQSQQTAQRTANLLEVLMGLAQTAEQALCGLEQREEVLRQAVKEQEMSLWSARLAHQLVDGEPCPVCGAQQHPHPAVHLPEEARQSETELERILSDLPVLRELKYSITRDMDNCRSLLQTFRDADETGPDQPLEGLTNAGRVPEEEGLHQAAASLEMQEKLEALPYDQMAETVQRLKERIGAARTELEGLKRQVKLERDQLALLQPKLAGLQAEHGAARQQVEQAAVLLEELSGEFLRLTDELGRELPGYTAEDVDKLVETVHAKDTAAEDVKKRLEVSGPFIEEKSALIQTLGQEAAELDKQQVQLAAQLAGRSELLTEKEGRLRTIAGEEDVENLLRSAGERLKVLRREAEVRKQRYMEADQAKQEAAKAGAAARQAAIAAHEQEEQLGSRFMQQLSGSPFTREEETAEALLSSEVRSEMEQRILEHREREKELVMQQTDLQAKLGGRQVTEEEWVTCRDRFASAKQADELAVQAKARAQRDLEDIQVRHIRWKELEQDRAGLEHTSGLLSKLQSSLRGNAFVEYVAEEQLMNVSQAASQRLRDLTKQRYSLETDSGGGFIICDDANGGIKRPVSTLSGGETFLTSLALALALSAQIQLRGQYPLQFFFLDEGFGTLDPELLDTVITSLEQLHHDHLSVGVISHVAELRARLPRKLVVIPAENAGSGSRIMIENL
ncbi:AAA family ATPase [Paenibacillus sp. J22TS3]|uniref:AAA family ATPase n=1 Tax=Paenibacillus sp. J22TS3 TaxID=2807192 RepID=UPI001B199677|nr:AAA family ATPase [Paenibacillus sp. J22TS3]GIP20541.1 nuclease SbcCD subunit C [Paenibacillus sp. J22TS3]